MAIETKTERRRQLRAEIEARYRARTAASLAAQERAQASLPGGDTRTSTFYLPYPLTIAKGAGARVTDLDGNTYLDLFNNYTALVHGHAHPTITAALAAQAALGTAYGAPTLSQTELAERVVARVPGIELTRFAGSGSEGVEGALSAARAFTGHARIVKAEGGFHGAIKDSGRDVVVPFNDTDRTVAALEQHAAELAAIMLEPVMGAGGVIPAERDYLVAVRDTATRLGVLLIFDEVTTLRLDFGGAQELFGVIPDLTVTGKLIGGGLPIGGFGGRADVMSAYDPHRPGHLKQSGTFTANPLSMVAGIASLDAFPRQEVARLNALGDRLRAHITASVESLGLPVQVTGNGSLLNLHITSETITSYADVAAEDKEALSMLHLALLNEGIFAAPRAMLCCSTPMTETDVDEVAAAVARALTVITPAVQS